MKCIDDEHCVQRVIRCYSRWLCQIALLSVYIDACCLLRTEQCIYGLVFCCFVFAAAAAAATFSDVKQFWPVCFGCESSYPNKKEHVRQTLARAKYTRIRAILQHTRSHIYVVYLYILCAIIATPINII